jgi:hypothetical protein
MPTGCFRDLRYTGLLIESLFVRDLRVLSQPLDASVTYSHTDHHEIDIVVQRASCRCQPSHPDQTETRRGSAPRRTVLIRPELLSG